MNLWCYIGNHAWVINPNYKWLSERERTCSECGKHEHSKFNFRTSGSEWRFVAYHNPSTVTSKGSQKIQWSTEKIYLMVSLLFIISPLFLYILGVKDFETLQLCSMVGILMGFLPFVFPEAYRRTVA